jgi:hypothetical protein
LRSGLKTVLRLRGIQCTIILKEANFRGTCAMKSREEGGVVDKFLNVYGTQNLKVAGNSNCQAKLI